MCRCAGLKAAVQACLGHDALSKLGHVQNTALAEGRSDSPAQVRFNLRMHAAARRGGPPLNLAASDEIMDLWSADPREQHG